jgi:glycosyltransferase involved in cell wall biosynthesis
MSIEREGNVDNISVIVPSYNHEKYIREAIYSVLNQTVPVLEIIVVDDASGDKSVQRVREISDKRIRIVELEQNVGGAEALNIGIAQANGTLIGICNSDDIWEPQKLEMQTAILKENPDVGFVFSDVTWIGEAGEEIRSEEAFGAVFQQSNRTRYKWMRHLFENGNCLCHPSILARRALYESVPKYDNRLRQLPDYKMWLSMLQHSSLHVMVEKLVRFRIHDNTSKPSPAVSVRDRNECLDIAFEFMSNLSEENFVSSFGSSRPSYDKSFNLVIEKIIYLWSVQSHMKSIAAWMANALAMHLLSTDDGWAAWRRYGFSSHEFHVLRGIESPWVGSRIQHVTSAQELDILRRIGADHWIVAPQPGASPPVSKLSTKLLAIWRHPLNRRKRKLYRKRQA